MAKIAKLNKDYYFDFDKCSLFSAEGKFITELKGREKNRLLRYFCENPNRPKSLIALVDILDNGCISVEAMKSRINRLQKSHHVFEETVIHTANGYKYIGKEIEEMGEIYIEEDESTNDCLEHFIQKTIQFESEMINAIMFCSCKWGSYTLDETQQNTNACEGVMALMCSSYDAKYMDTIEEVMDYLKQVITSKGLKSKSLDEETVVPTSMYLYLQNYFFKDSNEVTQALADNLWKSKGSNGWGIYIKKMDKFANIGCTYWAIMGLRDYPGINSVEFQKYLRSLFKYEGACTFGNTIDDVNPRFPKLYSTSMMYIIYNLLSADSKKQIGNRYASSKALKYIVDNFDNPIYLIEKETIRGTEIEGRIQVHSLPWDNISIDYSLTALSIAIKNGEIGRANISSILKRIENIVVENTVRIEGRTFFVAPEMMFENGSRGKMVFPTMHLIMGLSRIREVVEKDG